MKNHPTHFDSAGRAQMADVGDKPPARRKARAGGSIFMSEQAFLLLADGKVSKGDVLTIAKIAAVCAAKRASEWIPLCHPLPLESVVVDFVLDRGNKAVHCEVSVAATAKTGVEMETLVGVQAALLTVYDMLKSADRGMVLTKIRLLEKQGGKSGHYRAAE